MVLNSGKDSFGYGPEAWFQLRGQPPGAHISPGCQACPSVPNICGGSQENWNVSPGEQLPPWKPGENTSQSSTDRSDRPVTSTIERYGGPMQYVLADAHDRPRAVARWRSSSDRFPCKHSSKARTRQPCMLEQPHPHTTLCLAPSPSSVTQSLTGRLRLPPIYKTGLMRYALLVL